MQVALKRCNGSQNISDKNLNEHKIHRIISNENGLGFYGLTKYPKTKEFMMIMEFADEGSLRSSPTNNFNNTMWENKNKRLYFILYDLNSLHELGYLHKDFHSGNVLKASGTEYISDFGLSGPANEQKSDDKVHGVMPYIAPEVLNEFGKGTPEFYKTLAYNCMNANPNERPTAKVIKEKKLKQHSKKLIRKYQISQLHMKSAVYTSRTFTFSNLLPKPVNSSIITSYVNNDV
ncbi:unnamed protein product [Rhizophagus irregularis]|nr:unnamed protein product [Rhizophagus irregularis]